MKEKDNNVSLIAILGAIVCLTICILTSDSELVKIVCGIGIGMQIILAIDNIGKRKRDKQ